MSIAREDLKYFQSQRGSGRGSNDANNKIREKILQFAVELSDEFQTYPEWMEFSEKLNAALKGIVKSMYEGPFDKILLKKRGGRGHKHDFILDAYSGDDVVISKNLEFKHGSKGITDQPEYLSVSSNRYVKDDYATFFYDVYIPKLCAMDGGLDELLPSLDIYLKNIYKNKSTHPFFKRLDTLQSDKNSEFYKKKQVITHESISSFIESQRDSIDFERINKEIQESQLEKVFLLWDCKEFHIETISLNELTIVSLNSIRNGNTYLFDTLVPSTKHKFLLRWKNHLGVLFPAWQISLTR